MDDATATALNNLAAKTGRTVPEWLDIARSLVPLGHRAGLLKLKQDYGIGHGYANALMLTVRAEASPDAGADPVDLQYSGPKAGLRPLYDLLVDKARALGPDVELAPKKATVSLRRAKQFALLTPATKDRLDVGLNLPGAPGEGRLVPTSGMCTHKVGIRTADEVDDELLGWLRQAYEKAG
jgi:predicted transport protein